MNTVELRKQDEWEKYEVAVTMEGNLRLEDGKLVMEIRYETKKENEHERLI
tara:strand:- start:378 stop:530 length:153 start_codon:yes stop_codon:yes gene_type:complete